MVGSGDTHIAKIKNIDVPTLIVHSDDDISPVWTAQEINDAIDSSKLVVLEECGHFPYIESLLSFTMWYTVF